MGKKEDVHVHVRTKELAEGLEAVAPAHKAPDGTPPRTPSPVQPSPSPTLLDMFTTTGSTAKKYADKNKDPMYLPSN